LAHENELLGKSEKIISFLSFEVQRLQLPKRKKEEFCLEAAYQKVV